MSGNNATQKIDFTDREYEVLCDLFYILVGWIGNATPVIMNKRSTYQFKQEVFQKQASGVLKFLRNLQENTCIGFRFLTKLPPTRCL